MVEKEEIQIEGPDMNNDGKPDWTAKFKVPWWVVAAISIGVSLIMTTKALELW